MFVPARPDNTFPVPQHALVKAVLEFSCAGTKLVKIFDVGERFATETSLVEHPSEAFNACQEKSYFPSLLSSRIPVLADRGMRAQGYGKCRLQSRNPEDRPM